jgi:flagellar protein FliO/FliZ
MSDSPIIATSSGVTVPHAPAALTPGMHVFAAPDVAGPPPASGVAGLGQVILALCIVLGAIFVCAYFARRMRGAAGRGAAALNVVAEVRLGAKERAVLVQVGTTQLLLGVAPGQVNALHVLSETIPASSGPAAATTPSPFLALLRKSLGK